MAKRGAKLRWTLGLLALLAALTLAAPFLVPLEGFIPRVEGIAREALGQPVRIGSLRLHLLPSPRAVAKAIRIGARDDVRIGELEIVPELGALLSGRKAVRLVRAEDVVLEESALEIPGRMPKSAAGPVAIRRVKLERASLRHSTLKLPVFDAEALLGEEFALESARFETRDGALRVRVDPEAPGRARLALAAKRWTLPAGAPLVFDTLAAQGTLAGSRLDVPKLEGALYGGTVAGNARAEWGKLWKIGGRLDIARVGLTPLQQALGRQPKLTGQLHAQATFSASAKAPAQLANALSIDGPFEVRGGAYQGVDLSRVADLNLLTGRAAAEGTTRFEELKGKLQLRGKRVRINDLCMKSSTLVAGGFVEVAPDQSLSGRLGVSVARTGGFVGVPVALSGTAAEPTVRPTKGYTLGALVGTVLLPGVGTALGGSAGGAIEGSAGCK
jgi:uncharacterized protein involved in outer membrane biogenesis